MAAHYVTQHGDEPERKLPPIPGAEDAIACVPFVPWRCPSCGDGKPRTYGQRGLVRYHECRECGLQFRSLEMRGDDLGEGVAVFFLIGLSRVGVDFGLQLLGEALEAGVHLGGRGVDGQFEQFGGFVESHTRKVSGPEGRKSGS